MRASVGRRTREGEAASEGEIEREMGSGNACACALFAALDGTKEEEWFERLARVKMGFVREGGPINHNAPIFPRE